VVKGDITHADVERNYGYCPVYAFQVGVQPPAIREAVENKITIKRFDVFTDLVEDVRVRCENVQRMRDHLAYVTTLKKQPTASGL